MELIIGSHVSYKSSKGLLGCVEESISYNANSFMFYTGAPQNTKRSPINDELTTKAYQLMKEHNISKDNVIIHAPYIINLANNESLDKYNFSINFLKEEIKRAIALGINKIVLHPGSFVKLSREVGINNIINGLNKVLEDNNQVVICLETMAGKGSEIGTTFEEIKYIIDNVEKSNLLGVCFDTCHLNDSGYDMSNFDNLLDEFDKLIGITKIKCIHINDSYNGIGTRKDRHSNIGYGTVGFNNLINIIYNPRLASIMKILETPYITKDDTSKERLYPPYKEEIKMIKEKKFNDKLIDEIREKNK